MVDVRDLRMVFDQHGKPIPHLCEIVFTHECDVTGTIRHFAVQRIEADIASGVLRPNIIKVAIDNQFAAFAFRYRGVEQHRWARLTERHIKTHPIVFAHMPGVARDDPSRETLIIDGIHRYTKAAALGHKTIFGYVLETEEWEPYVVTGIPDEINEKQREKLAGQARGIPIDSYIP